MGGSSFVDHGDALVMLADASLEAFRKQIPAKSCQGAYKSMMLGKRILSSNISVLAWMCVMFHRDEKGRRTALIT
jgi:hypothetical protein